MQIFTHLIFLFGDLVLQFKLLCLQLVHPLPQLFGLLSARCTNSTMSFSLFLSHGVLISNLTDILHLPESLLVQGVDVQWFASLTQDLLLLFPLCLPFATALFCLQKSQRNQDLIKNTPQFRVCSPASACTPQNGGSWGFSFSWHHLRLSSWLPPLPYEFSHPRFERIKSRLFQLCWFWRYFLDRSLNVPSPPGASAVLSPSRCGFFAALLAQRGDFPAQQTLC